MPAPRAALSVILALIFLMSVFSLSVVKMDDTDAWTHLSFGRLIWQQQSIPTMEPFIDTSAPFPYNNWLFGFVYFLAWLAAGASGVVLLKAVTITGAFYILLRDSVRPHNNYLAAIAVLTFTTLLSRHRFVERPDTFLMVFLPFSIFALNAFVIDNKKYLYALPLVHLLWGNSHTSLPLMAVPFLSFLFGGALQLALEKRGVRFTQSASRSHLKTIAAVFAASFAASLISPYGFGQYLHGAQAINSDWWKQEVVELQKTTWQTYKSPYIITGLLAALLIVNFLRAYRSGSPGAGKAYPSPIHLFLIAPFIVLSFSAIRFIFLYAMISAPIISRYVSALVPGNRAATERPKRFPWAAAATAALVLWIFIYTGSVLAGVGLFNDNRRPGFGVNDDAFPEKALQYMDRRNIIGRIYNLFQLGGYIIWRDYPKRKPFIDGRGFVSAKMLEKVDSSFRTPKIMEELSRQYGFEAVMVPYPSLISDIAEVLVSEDQALPNPAWALVYWDDQVLIYLKRGGRYESIISEDEYRFVKPANGIYGVINIHDEGYRDRVIAELRRNISETRSSRAYALMGAAFNDGGLYRQAIDSFSHVKSLFLGNISAMTFNGLGYAYYKLDELDQAAEYYEKSLAIAKDAQVYYNLGTIYLKKGDSNKAAKSFERALEVNPTLTSAYSLLISTYRDLGEEQKAQRAERAFQSAISISNGQKYFEDGMKAYTEHRYEDAIAALKKSIEANPSNPVPYSNLGFIYLDIFDLELAYQYDRKALEVDPDHANAHYGLALIYKQRGMPAEAEKHWREYLRIEPAGYYSRRAKEEIALIERRRQ